MEKITNNYNRGKVTYKYLENMTKKELMEAVINNDHIINSLYKRIEQLERK